jgi:hypothetical protein
MATFAFCIRQGDSGDNMLLRMYKNMGRLDQLLRLGMGMALVYVGIIDSGLISDQMFALLVGAVGVVNLVAATFRTCPVYLLAGINTNNQSGQ